MISARKLAEVHTSFWDLLAPNLPRLVRSINLSGRDVFAAPMTSRVPSDRIYFVNEVGFELCLRRMQGRSRKLTDVVDAVAARFSSDPRIGPGRTTLTEEEVSDSEELADRLSAGIPKLISHNIEIIENEFGEKTRRIASQKVPTRPIFSGAGLLDQCEGDFRFDKNLIEVKSGDRNLRSTDYRQILIYYSLSVLAEEEPVDSCLLLNPRQGYRVYLEFAELISAISGQTNIEFVANFRDYLVDWKECD